MRAPVCVGMGMSLQRSQVDSGLADRLGDCVSETRGHCTQRKGVFPQGLSTLMCGKCSALGLNLDSGPWVSRGKDRWFAGRRWRISTGLSTPVQNGEKPGTVWPHSPVFLLKMGKSISGSVVCLRGVGFFDSRIAERMVRLGGMSTSRGKAGTWPPAEGRCCSAGVRQWRSGIGDSPQAYGALWANRAAGVSAFHSIHRGPVYAWSVRGNCGSAGGLFGRLTGAHDA